MYSSAFFHKPIHVLILVVSCTLVPVGLSAAENPAKQMDWFSILIGLGGGLALFLAGLEQLSDGLKKVAGQTLKIMLARLTTNRFMGAITGAVVTGILNSSSITTVLVVGFVTAGVMSLSQSVGVIMGANIGSTVTAQLLAFNIAKYALLPIAVGFFLIFVNKGERPKYFGMMLMGLGLVFFGMSIMSDAMSPLRSYEPFLVFLQKMQKPVLGIIAGALFTGLVQSSAATVGIAIALASEGFLPLEAGIALALGANIGTCVTALLAALGKPTEAVRAAVVHICFNIAGVLVWLFFISSLADIAIRVSPQSPELTGSARMAAEVPRQIANANSIFNVINTIVFLPFTAVFAWIARTIVPERLEQRDTEPLYIDNAVLDVPSIALERVRQELARIGEITLEMLDATRLALKSGLPDRLSAIQKEDDKIDILEAACIEYLSKIRKNSLTVRETKEHQVLLMATVALENIGDVIETNLVELSEQELGIHYTKSDETAKLTEGLYVVVHDALSLMCRALRNNSLEDAHRVVDLEVHIRKLRHDLMVRKSERLGSSNHDAVMIARIEISTASKLMRIYNLTKSIATELIDSSESYKADQSYP
ncbi:MAG: Na/Pi cotransporter family protein [Desulfobulbaceae bacterium]|nr:MAG: Na/Pi cotransporter family protein [Desulfobulbaceae bacterium]